ncbi:MAG: FAD-dependent oxidoreductase [Bryobacteraceae bacterium]
MLRRTLLQTLAAPFLLSAAPRELAADAVIVGAGVGGCAAALAALRNGLRVILTEETDWIGGQLTAQAVPPDEHQWIEQFGSTRAYRDYRNAVRDFYRRHYPLTADAMRRPNLNPGDGSVSRLTHEPRVSLAVLEAMLAPYASSGQLTLLLEHKPVSADVSGDRIRAVSVRSLGSFTRILSAPYFLDATEQGDLLPLTKTEFVTGFESQRETAEPHAPSEAQPANIQSFTVCFAIDYKPGEDHTIDKPEQYAFWRDYVPDLKPAWTGKLLSWAMTDPQSLKSRSVWFSSDPAAPGQPGLNLWLYRRILSAANFTPGFASDISLVNWPQNDYWLGNLHGVSDEDAARHLHAAKQLSLSLLYWMQTNQGFKGLRLRHDITGTEDGLAKYPYIRESRRILAEFTVLEQHVAAASRPTGIAEKFPDSVGVGSYRIDLHPTSAGDNYIDVASVPFQIPMGALIPRRVDNLLAAAKNLGVTHITNGCYRLHPVEWNIGESAGALAAEAIATKRSPSAIRANAKSLEAFQKKLTADGIELAWPLAPR